MGAQRHQRLDQHGRLGVDVSAADDSGTDKIGSEKLKMRHKTKNINFNLPPQRLIALCRIAQ